MSVQIVLDVTNEYLSGSESGTPYLVKLDVGGYDYAVIQAINPSIGDTIAIKSTNDSGDIQGVSDGSAVSSINAFNVFGIDLATNTPTTTLPSTSLVRVQSVGRYIWLDGVGDGVTVDKLLVRLYKIH